MRELIKKVFGGIYYPDKQIFKEKSITNTLNRFILMLLIFFARFKHLQHCYLPDHRQFALYRILNKSFTKFVSQVRTYLDRRK